MTHLSSDSVSFVEVLNHFIFHFAKNRVIFLVYWYEN